MCTVLLLPGVNSIPVNKYIISSRSTICFDIKQINYFLKLCTFEFHVILKTNGDYLLKYQQSIGLFNKYGMCSVWGIHRSSVDNFVGRQASKVSDFLNTSIYQNICWNPQFTRA